MVGSNRASSWLTFAQRSRDEGGLGLAPHQAAGLVGNLVKESGDDLEPWGPTGDNGTAWGTAQWRGDRLSGLKAHAAANGLDHRSMEAQQSWLREEMLGSEKRAYDALIAAKTPEEAATAVNKYYERSADTTGGREAAARQLMAQFGEGADQGALSSAYAPTGKPTMPSPALSVDNTLGNGVLNLPTGADGAGDDKVANGLMGIGASLAGISNPEQAKAMIAQQAAWAKAPGQKWSVAHVDPKTGQALLTNGQSFISRNVFAPKADDDTYVEEAKKKSAESNVKYGDEISKSAAEATNQAGTVSELRRVLSNPEVYQGGGGEMLQSARKIFAGLGFGDPQAIADGDMARALGNKLALQLVNNGGSKLLPGSMSDSDREFVTRMSTSLNIDAKANQRLLDIYERANNRVMETERARQAHVDANDGIIKPSFRTEVGKLHEKWAAEDKARNEADAAAAKDTPPSQTTVKPNTFTTKSGKTINWSVH